MVKSFSVDWMARSHYEILTEQDTKLLENTSTHFRKHIPCTVQPRPPTCYTNNSVQLKPNVTTDDKDKQSCSNDPSSPTGSSSPSFSENSGYSSGYESEATAVESPSTEEDNERENAEMIHRRARTKFTSEQIYKLERTFKKHKYLDPTERIKTAAKLNLSETQVRTWFQNRRMKLKREVQDWSTEHLAPGLMFPAMFLPRAPAFQHHGSLGQRLPFIQAAHAVYQHPMPQNPTQHTQHPMHAMYY
ncbi:hypothetical protein AAFF_G00137190 [Aldrovandia affinis]|uniref:Homeobox domain-containing protein n=1 Tax=Aldrovandia affinis TaxID=143900 RepID=A0AAD7TBS7_9TELE|nr:hypothetical protein AAFF_G00137190 [Aldrovandia affinis]